MASTDDNAVWVKKGATLSDKTAQKEFGLSQEEIIEAIKAGKLHYRRWKPLEIFPSMHQGIAWNPYF